MDAFHERAKETSFNIAEGYDIGDDADKDLDLPDLDDSEDEDAIRVNPPSTPVPASSSVFDPTPNSVAGDDVKESPADGGNRGGSTAAVPNRNTTEAVATRGTRTPRSSNSRRPLVVVVRIRISLTKEAVFVLQRLWIYSIFR